MKSTESAFFEQYQPADRPLWPAAGSWAHKVPGWQLGWWRWRAHTAAESAQSGLVLLRWHQNSWLPFKKRRAQWKLFRETMWEKYVKKSIVTVTLSTQFHQTSPHFHSCLESSCHWRAGWGVWGRQSEWLRFLTWEVPVSYLLWSTLYPWGQWLRCPQWKWFSPGPHPELDALKPKYSTENY